MMMELRQKSSPTREISLWKLTKAKEKRQQRETTHSKGKKISHMPHPCSVLKKIHWPIQLNTQYFVEEIGKPNNFYDRVAEMTCNACNKGVMPAIKVNSDHRKSQDCKSEDAKVFFVSFADKPDN